MTTTPVRPRRPIREALHIMLPNRWREIFTHPAAIASFDRYERLIGERKVAHDAMQAAQQALKAAGVEDHNAMVAAIYEAKKPPAGDANAKAAEVALTEATRLRDAVFQAFDDASRDAIRVVEENSDALEADLTERIAKKSAQVGATLEQLDSEFTELSWLRAGRLFVTDRAHRFGDPQYGPWQRKLVPEIRAMIAEPSPSSEPVTVTGDQADGEDDS